MQSQEQPLALTAVTSRYSTNGKEEEVNTGEEALSPSEMCSPPYQVNTLDERLNENA